MSRTYSITSYRHRIHSPTCSARGALPFGFLWRNNVEIDYADREKLFEGLAIMAKIIAKEVAKEIVVQQSKADPALPKEKLALSCTDAAKLLGVSTTTVSKMIREGKIPAIRYYRKILIPYNALKKQFSEMPDGQWVPPTV